jgi:hypothetical protein
MEQFLDIMQWTWDYMPFPIPLVLLSAAGFFWLWIEYLTTRAGRRIPGWHRPMPILPEISVVVVRVIRICWILIRLWPLLFASIALVFWIQPLVGYPDWLGDIPLFIGRIWRGAYDISMRWLAGLWLALTGAASSI